MLYTYNFNRVNEEVQEGTYDYNEAVEAVKKAKIFDDISVPINGNKSIWDQDGFVYATVIGSYKGDGSRVFLSDNRTVVYCFNNKKILTPEPIFQVFHPAGGCSYIIVHKKSQIVYYEVNMMNQNGYIFPNMWFSSIDLKSIDGWHKCEYLGDALNETFNAINANGDFFFGEPMESVECVGSFFEGMFDGKKTLYRISDGEPLVSGYNVVYYLNWDFYDQKQVNYKLEYDNFCEVRDESMNLIATMLADVDRISHNYNEPEIIELLGDNDGKEFKRNILGPNGTLVLGKPDEEDKSLDRSEWADTIEYDPCHSVNHFELITRNEKMNIFDAQEWKLLFDKWYDKIVFTEDAELGVGEIVCLKSGNECNIMGVDPKIAYFKKMLFPEPVENIKKYEDCPFIFVTKDGQDYIVWRNQRLISVPVDGLKETKEDLYWFIKKDGKFDLISTESDQTFCELYMNGEKFDACYDLVGEFPIVEYNGKLGYIDLEMFRPALSIDHKKMIWFDDADLAEEDYPSSVIFPVTINGEKKYLDEFGMEFEDDEKDEVEEYMKSRK